MSMKNPLTLAGIFFNEFLKREMYIRENQSVCLRYAFVIYDINVWFLCAIYGLLC